MMFVKLLFLKVRLSLLQARQNKKSHHFVCAHLNYALGMLIMHKILRSKDTQCNTRKSPKSLMFLTAGGPALLGNYMLTKFLFRYTLYFNWYELTADMSGNNYYFFNPPVLRG